MVEPSRRSTRHIVAAAALSAFALLGAGFSLGYSAGEKQRPPAPAPSPAPAASPTPPGRTLPVPQPPLGRAELLAAAAAAADAFAAGQPVPAAVAALGGREFEIRIPFGCPGEPSRPRLGWTYDEESERLRLRAEPVRWPPEQWTAAPGAVAGPAVELVEGFWIERPWTSNEACPASAAPSTTSVPAEAGTTSQPLPPEAGTTPQPLPPPAEPTQTLGLAQFFTDESSRVGRREGQPFEAVEPVAPDALDTRQGFRLRIRGRIAPAPNGPPLLCRAGEGPGTRPVCLISARFDEVAFEQPATGATLATWDVANSSSPRRRAAADR